MIPETTASLQTCFQDNKSGPDCQYTFLLLSVVATVTHHLDMRPPYRMLVDTSDSHRHDAGYYDKV